MGFLFSHETAPERRRASHGIAAIRIVGPFFVESRLSLSRLSNVHPTAHGAVWLNTGPFRGFRNRTVTAVEKGKREPVPSARDVLLNLMLIPRVSFPRLGRDYVKRHGRLYVYIFIMYVRLLLIFYTKIRKAILFTCIEWRVSPDGSIRSNHRILYTCIDKYNIN